MKTKKALACFLILAIASGLAGCCVDCTPTKEVFAKSIQTNNVIGEQKP